MIMARNSTISTNRMPPEGRVITFLIVTTAIALAIGFICGYGIGGISSDIEWKRVIKRTAKSSAHFLSL
jgi:hypothetical protein